MRIFSLFALAILTATSLYAQTDSTTMQDVVVSGNRLQSTLRSTGRSVSVLETKEMKKLNGQTPADWLATVGGVDVRQRGPVGVQSDIGIRGGSFDQSLVLLNGMKLSDPQTGHHMMNIPLPLDAMERIEVIKSASSRMYGINALSGSINFITKVPEKNMVYAGAYGGDFGLYGLNAGVAFNTKNLGQHISFSRSASDGYTSNTDFKINNVFYQATVKTGKAKINILGGYTTRDFGAAGFYVPAPREEYESTKTAFTGVQYELRKEKYSIRSHAYFRYNDDHYIFRRSNPSVFQNQHYTHVAGAELHGTYKSILGETGVGLEARTERINSRNLGDRQRNILGAYAEHRIKFLKNKLLITPGVFVNAVAGNSNNFAAFPGIDASYLLHSNWTIFASSDKGMRLPTYTDLYYNGPSNIGNPNLKPEEAINNELGVRMTTNKFHFSVTGFNRSSSNLIDWALPNTIVLPISAKWQPLNINRVNFTGAEINAAVQFKGILNRLSANYTYIDAVFKQPENQISRYALSNMKQQAVGIVQFNWYKGFVHTFTVRYIDRVTMSDYTLLDSKLSYLFKKFTVYAEASNIFNTNYTEAAYVVMPGRWFKAGVEMKLFY